jgi:hypothetical protein
LELLKMAKSLLVMLACVNKHNMNGLEVCDFSAFEDERIQARLVALILQILEHSKYTINR